MKGVKRNAISKSLHFLFYDPRTYIIFSSISFLWNSWQLILNDSILRVLHNVHSLKCPYNLCLSREKNPVTVRRDTGMHEQGAVSRQRAHSSTYYILDSKAHLPNLTNVL
jgi:hypothetical protein